MGDPFSVAGSAVGTISLGLQICQGLQKYLRSIQGRKSFIADGLKEVDELGSILQTIRLHLLQNNTQKYIEVTAIHKCLATNEGKLLELQKSLIDLRGPKSITGIKGKALESGRLMAHPFREDKLKDIQAKVRQLRDNLSFSLIISSFGSNLAQRDMLDGLADRIQSVETEVQAQMVGINNLQLKAQDISNKTEKGFVQAEFTIRDVEQNISGKLDLIPFRTQPTKMTSGEDLKKLLEGMEKSASAQLINVDAAIERQHQYDAGRCQRPPEYSNHIHPQASDIFARQLVQSKTPFSVCDCPRKSRPYMFSTTIGYFKFQFEKHPLRHHPGCKLYGIDRNYRRSYKAEFPLNIEWLCDRTRSACVDFTTGAGSLGCSLRYRNIVKTTAVDNIIRRHKLFPVLPDTSPEDIIRNLRSVEHDMIDLYRNGEASPDDENSEGQNNAMILARKFLQELNGICSDCSVMMAAIKCLHTLHQPSRCEDTEINATDLFMAVYHLQTSITSVRANAGHFISYIEKDFGIILPDSRPYWSLVCGALSCILFRELPNIHRELDLPPIISAITQKSLTDLNICINLYPESPTNEFLGETTLVWCLHWPQGLQRLLETEAKQLIDGSASSKHRPIEVAVELELLEPVNILLQAGCQFDFETFPLTKMSDGCIDILASNLARRRKDLLGLYNAKIGFLDSSETSIVADKKASFLCKGLRDAGFRVPPTLDVTQNYCTIYHCPNIDAKAFEVFYRHGFGDITTFNHLGLTPIMVFRKRIFNFFSSPLVVQREELAHQTPKDLIGIGINTSATAWHYLSSMLICENLNLSIEKLSMLQQFFKYMDTCAIKDRCTCWCVTNNSGCSPLHSLWKVIGDYGHIGDNDINKHRDWIDHILFHHDLFATKELSTISLALVRLLTFEALEMTHTCCLMRTYSVLNQGFITPSFSHLFNHHHSIAMVITNHEPEAEQERQQQKITGLLNTLMDEFISQMRSSESSPRALETFICGYWSRRIARLYRIDNEAIKGMKQVVANVETHILPQRVQLLLGSMIASHLSRMIKDIHLGGSDDLHAEWMSFCYHCFRGNGWKLGQPRAFGKPLYLEAGVYYTLGYLSNLC